MRGFGHGVPTPIAAEEAFAIAAQSTPAPPRASQPFCRGSALGATVRARADDYGRDAVEGELVFIDSDENALRRHDQRVGDIVVHFPRLGYDIGPSRFALPSDGAHQASLLHPPSRPYGAQDPSLGAVPGSAMS